jgi:hypothetical protein
MLQNRCEVQCDFDNCPNFSAYTTLYIISSTALKLAPEANILAVYLDLFVQLSMGEKSLDIDPLIHDCPARPVLLIPSLESFCMNYLQSLNIQPHLPPLLFPRVAIEKCQF